VHIILLEPIQFLCDTDELLYLLLLLFFLLYLESGASILSQMPSILLLKSWRRVKKVRNKHLCSNQCSGSGSGSYIFGPPGSGSISQRYGSGSGSSSGSFYHQAKQSKNFDSYFLSLKNYVNVPSKSSKQKNLEHNTVVFVGILKVNDEIAGSGPIFSQRRGSVPKCHGSAALAQTDLHCLVLTFTNLCP
jgi:hypothetical protein